jgi:hypothetical protein
MGQGIAVVDVLAEVEEQFQIQGALHAEKKQERQKINVITFLKRAKILGKTLQEHVNTKKRATLDNGYEDH